MPMNYIIINFTLEGVTHEDVLPKLEKLEGTLNRLQIGYRGTGGHSSSRIWEYLYFADSPLTRNEMEDITEKLMSLDAKKFGFEGA